MRLCRTGISVTVVLSVFMVGNVQAQMMCNLGTSGFVQYNPNLDQPPSSRATLELMVIYEALCPDSCGEYLLVSNQTVPNALAVVIGPGQTKIGYKPEFMYNVESTFGSGATLGILAHEFGHHIDLNTFPSWMSNSWSRELRADAWAGCTLAKLYENTYALENALKAIASFPSPTHPPWQQRLLAVRSGYFNCGGSFWPTY